MKKEYTIKYVSIELIKVISYIVIALFIVAPIVYVIYFVTYEPNKKGVVTLRKIKRIRLLTKLKLWIYNHFKRICDWCLFGNSFKELKLKIERNGV